MAGHADGECSRREGLDYYQLLQIDPDAPHELIAEAYWFLASRLRAEQSARRSAEKELSALNDAYTALAGPAQREAYDATLPRVSTLRRMRAERAASTARQQSFLARLLKKPLSTPRPDYYELLCLDPAADSPMVARAYSILHTLHSRQELPDEEYVADLASARDTLLDANRRAEYDRQRVQASTTAVDKRTEEIETGTSAKTPVEEQSTAVASVEAETPPDLPDRRLLRERIPAPFRVEDSGGLCLARLHIVDAKGTRQVDLGDRPLVLGSGLDCDVALEPQNGVAAEHAQIWCADGRFAVRSLSPSHQTLVNGQRINWALLEGGDEIEIGRYRVRFEANSLPSFLTVERDSIKLTEDVPERADQ